ncbi:hypothetical protein QCA50_007784 [Cerrena zonata]|uniref:PAN2-PAN3 deadenylation complex catalytic subunit PAN2 n=1 Tax=Cerrena zonata TaxID=2478898 RepID=A0AAW0G5Z7_9APHY
MSTLYHAIPPIAPGVDLFPIPVTALAFDPLSDTLWTGSDDGKIVAYHGTQGMRGVVFPVGGNYTVQNIIATDASVRAFGVSSDGLGAWTRGGVNKWFYRCNPNTSVTAMSNSSASIFFAATSAQELLSINVHTGNIVRKTPTFSTYNNLVDSHTGLVSGSLDGYVRIHDSRKSMDIVHNIQAHLSGVKGLEVGGNFLFTIGTGTRQGHPFPDPLVKIYDMRTMRALPPVPFSGGPAFLNRLPTKSSTIIVTSNEGLVNVVDASNPADSQFHQLSSASYITSVAVSPTGSYMAFGDADGIINLLTAAEDGADVPFNGFEGHPIEWADPPEEVPTIEWSETTPLNSVGMPYYHTQLLSSWTPRLISTSVVSPLPPKIPQQVLDTMKFNDNVAYATLPKELRGRRNVVVSGPKKSGGRFRHQVVKNNEPDTPVFEHDPEDVPKMYRKVEIEYSKFGVEDFDFGFYNHTEYSGLETHILNSYTNPLLQLLHYSRPIRTLAESHITADCRREHCLFCELGFVVRMLEDAKGTNCQSTNFCKTLGFMAQISNLIELIDYGRESAALNYAHMIQSCHRFLIENLSLEGNGYPQNPPLLPKYADGRQAPPSPITQIVGIHAKNVLTCGHCHTTREKDQIMHVIDLVYPRKPPTNSPSDGTDLASIVRTALLRHTTHKASCSACNKPSTTFESRRSISNQDLPHILALNACVFNEDSHQYWKDGRRQTFLKPTLEVRGQVNGHDEPEAVLYELRGLVVQVITKAKQGPTHLVALIKVPEAESTQQGDEDSSWYIFNDFSVQNISEEEALSFPGSWKVPAILYFERIDTQSQLDFRALPKAIDPSILCQDTNISMNRNPHMIKHECLSPEELPRPGALVAIDAEFVLMQQEETEYRSDGTKKVIRPARLSLARVSALRGDGISEGEPFIDDHIHTSEMIVDYLTEFSGIKFGDLDPQVSPHTLTPLKVVYKKLRLLVDRGCIFIGHGLSKDFRIINIFVPPYQVIDTVDLYYLPSRSRRLSLRFLAWFFFRDNIQTDTHDSIEDALTALKLYKTHLQFEAEGIFDRQLERIYKEGRQYNFKPPQAEGSPPVRPSSAGVMPVHPTQSNRPRNPFAPPPPDFNGHGNVPVFPRFFAPVPQAFPPNWRHR